MKAIILTLALMALSTPVSAEWGLYLNADNKRWNLTKTFAFEKDCDSAARSAVRSKQALGAGCSEYAALTYRPTARAREQAAAVAAERARANAAVQTDKQRQEQRAESMHRDNIRVQEEANAGERAKARAISTNANAIRGLYSRW
jgi:hypothetical protein